MIEYIIGYGSIAVVILWLSIVFIRARYYKKTSIKSCNMNCATCGAKREELEKQIIASSEQPAGNKETVSCCH